MAKIRFIHTSDLHIGTPFKGLSSSNPELFSRIKDASYKAFRRIIDVAIDEAVDFVIIAGDIFDSENNFVADQVRFCSELERLHHANIASYFICGNHDPLNSWFDTNELPPSSFRFGSSDVQKAAFIRNGVVVADIYGISFETKAVNDNLALLFKIKQPAAPVSIAVMHGTVGASTGHIPYAPCSLADLFNESFDYWALGHIHKQGVLKEFGPAIAYSGNPQGRSFAETGSKGCLLVEIEPGLRPEIKSIPVHVIRFEEVAVDITEINSINELSSKIQGAVNDSLTPDGVLTDVDCILRISIRGRSELHGILQRPGQAAELQNLLNDGLSHTGQYRWIDKIEIQTSPPISLVDISKREDFTGAVARELALLQSDPQKLSDLLEHIQRSFLVSPIANDLAEISSDEKAEILERAKWKLLDQLIENQQ